MLQYWRRLQKDKYHGLHLIIYLERPQIIFFFFVFYKGLFLTILAENILKSLGQFSINLLLILFYRFACYFSIKVSDSDYSIDEVSLAFGHSMLPIAFAYHVTHYLSLFLFESQTFLYRLNDPIGTGLNLFGVNQVNVE